jgi:hypothetical protein
VCVQEVNACVNQGTIFTMEESGDGWDDVRRSVIDAKKVRAASALRQEPDSRARPCHCPSPKPQMAQGRGLG